MLSSSNLVIRAFEPSDAGALAALQHADEADVRRCLGQPNLVPGRDCVMAERDGKPVGYGYLVVERALSRGVLLAGAADDAAEVLDALLASAMERARGFDLGVLQVDVPESESVARARLASAGFAVVRSHRHLKRTATEPTGAALPAGAVVRLAGREDMQTLTDLQNAAFTGSWGYSPNTVEEITYRVFQLPTNAPDPVVLIEVGSDVLGYCWAHQERLGDPGIIDMVGVPPHRQGEGLGRAVTAAGIDELVRIGAVPIEITVDSENGPAGHVYEGLGFVESWRSVWYELAL
jgi:mycothiol synthase